MEDYRLKYKISNLFSNNISKANNSTPTELQQPTETFFDNVSNNKRWAFFKLQPNIFHLVLLDTISTGALSGRGDATS